MLPHLPNLRHVSVSGTHVEESGLLAIGQHCSALRELDVSSLLSFKDAVAEAVLGPEAANGGKLTTFIATASRMTSVGAAYLGRHTNLQILSMQLNTGVQDWTFLASLHQVFFFQRGFCTSSISIKDMTTLSRHSCCLCSFLSFADHGLGPFPQCFGG